MSTVFSWRWDKRQDLINASAYHRDPLLYFDRQVKHIQRSLQVLLDAQSDGLLAGLTAPGYDGDLSHADFSRTSSELSSSRRPSLASIKQPEKKKIGLRAAREGILKSMHNLLKLRDEEKGVIAAQIDGRKDALMEIGKLGSKRTGLEESISAIQNDSEAQRSTGLREEAHNLEADINELETRLYEMKNRHRRVLNEISQHDNAVEAKLSSYRTALSLVESDIQRYLYRPPLEPLASIAEDNTFYSLNPSRRTLHMARAHWKSELARLEHKQQEINVEADALDDGIVVWKQAAAAIQGFEKRLRAEMRSFIQTQSQMLQPNSSLSGKTKEEQVKAILEDLKQTSRFVEERLDYAQEKDWKLLVCCIGTELEALNEAQGLLYNAFNVSTEKPADHEPERDRVEAEEEGDDSHASNVHDVDNPEPPDDLLKDTDAQSSHGHEAIYRSEDDEPDPAWLLPET